MRMFRANYVKFPAIDVINPATYAFEYNLS
jgi:hypothetical protein